MKKGINDLGILCMELTESLILNSFVFQVMTLDVKKSIPVIIEFDPAFENNAFSRTARSQLVVSYKDHPHEV